jgi:hypothetical protein
MNTIRLDVHNSIHYKLDKFLETRKIPHILFYGNSGSGKRTIVNNFINKIYNNDNRKIKANVMYVNCAHGKGIKFIREDLKFFAKTNIKSNDGSNFKTIVLLNASFLTIDAQSALRRCIELFSYNTRFFMVVENKNKILYPILSRFCEIYIPDYVVDGKKQNLHEYSRNSKYELTDNKKRDTWIHKQINNVKEKNHITLLELSEEIYNEGYSCFDIIRWLINKSKFSEIEISNTCIIFDKIRLEYRCEKLLILYILDYLYLRSEKDLKCITTI